jgi:tetratricopeptide (TPR) repeat protein
LLVTKHPFAQLQQALRTRGACRDVALELLTPDDVERYLDLQFPGHQFTTELLRRIHMKTEGNPLFMVDLVRDLRDRKVIAEDQGHWILAQPSTEIDPGLPESVRGLIDRKISRLKEEERRLLSAASVQGYEFDSAVIAQALDLDAADVEDQLESLERVHVLVRQVEEREFPDHTFTLRYRFAHVLYQNALYTALRPTRKAQIAGTLARTLERCWGEQHGNVANQLALLFETARDFARAANYFQAAAQNAISLFASQEAVALANRALAMIEMTPQGRDRLEQELSVRIVLANALIAIRGYGSPEVEQTYTRARQLCQELGETPYRLPALWGLNVFQLMKARYRETLTLGKEFLSLVLQQNDPAIVIAHRVVGQAFFFTGNLTKAREHFEEIVSLYVPERHRPLTWLYAQEPGMAGEALLGFTLWLLGYPDQALMHSEKSLRLGRETPQANSQANAFVWAAIQHQFRRENEKVRELAEALASLATEQGLRFWLAGASIQHGWAIADQGRFDEGIEKMRRGIAGFRSAGAEILLTFNLGLMAELYGKIGRPREGLMTLNEAFTLPGNEETFWQAELYRLKGELLLMQDGAAAEVEECFDRSISIVQQQKARSLELRAAMSMSRLWTKQGKPAEAHALLSATLASFTEGFETADLREARALLEDLARR